MKISFDGKELSWLNTYIGTLVTLSQKRYDEPSKQLYIQAAKMRYKFTPAATVCYLKKMERELVSSLASHRLKDLDSTQSLSEERDTVVSIINKTKGVRA